MAYPRVIVLNSSAKSLYFRLCIQFDPRSPFTVFSGLKLEFTIKPVTFIIDIPITIFYSILKLIVSIQVRAPPTPLVLTSTLSSLTQYMWRLPP